ncbi:MAG: PEP-CTERM sorting domain-containing protein [Acidobacteriia bacterium]|nr:PEP-CTERM sorting domain-containing protein [Terriglobia bacterium]
MKSLIVTSLLLGLTAIVSASIITQNTSATNVTGGSGFFIGQSVTTPGGGPWDNIGFNYVDNNSNPFALGGLYLLTQTYTGLPSGLSNATPGFVASTSTISGGVWTFASGVTLSASTQYFFYMDTAFNGSEILFSYPGTYAGGVASQADNFLPNYSDNRAVDMTFTLAGTQFTAVPEPATASLMLAAIGLAAAFRRRRA